MTDMNFDNHPCFNAKAHKDFGRVHLPVAPRCNIQCKFCDRKFDCVNESRPGVTSGILKPYQAMAYLETVMETKPNISVVGIAGPGDPFANPEETMETLRLVRQKYPEMMLCVATNGLGIGPHLDELAELKVSHVTVTINAVDLEIAEKVYSWVRWGKRVRRAAEGVRILMEKQLEAVKGLKDRNMVVKVNSIIIPGINDHHIPEVARRMSEMGVDIFNAVPFYPNEGAAFADIPEPPQEMVNTVRAEAGKFIPQMRHCKRCRADAVGLLGEVESAALMNRLKECQGMSEEISARPIADTAVRNRVAVASMEGVLVNQHLGEAEKLLIYERDGGVITLKEARDAPPRGGGIHRWNALAETLSDCRTLLVSGVGDTPKLALNESGLDVMEIEGLIEDAVRAVFDGQSLNHMIRPNVACGSGCGGGGMGCGA
jgi:nitrogen fixation protein NifB